MNPAPLADLVEPGWARVLAPVAGQVAALGEFLRAETRAGRRYLPEGANVLRAFSVPLDRVRVLILGQDPYPTPGHAVGLAFSAHPAVRPIPRSLVNIYRELFDDLGMPVAPHGDLSRWERQGVLLLNRVLTVSAGAAGSHRGRGWEAVTDVAIRGLVARGGPLVAILWGRDAAGAAPLLLNRVLTVSAGAAGSHRGRGWEAVTDVAIRGLVARGGPLVAILWGRDAASAAPLLGSTPIVASAHPSPLSAAGGFFGSRPFSRANELLVAQGAAPIDWSVDEIGTAPAGTEHA